MPPILLPIDEAQNRQYGRYPGFVAFWAAYPAGKGSKAEAFKMWLRHGCEPYALELIGDVRERTEKDEVWARGYIPHARTYLSQHRWQDEINMAKEEQPTGPKSDTEWMAWGKSQGVEPSPGESWQGYIARLRSSYHKDAH